jgi:hypothetical protein
MPVRRIAQFPFLLCCIIALGGCWGARFNLAYAPTTRASDISGAEAIGVHVAVVDQRPEPKILYQARNGYGCPCGVIVTERPLSDILADGMRSDLRMRGFSNGDSIQLRITIKQFEGVVNRMNGDVAAKAICVIDVIKGNSTIHTKFIERTTASEQVFFLPSITTALEPKIQELINLIISETGRDDQVLEALFAQ